MRLTTELVNARISHKIGALDERCLDLRGLGIGRIENLGAARDWYRVYDFSDNQIVTLGGFPRSPHLKVLVATCNRITNLEPDLFSDQLQNLESLILTNNMILSLSELDCLNSATSLVRLSLLGNPVTDLKLSEEELVTLRDVLPTLSNASELYRSYVITACPSVRILDFQKVTSEDRKRAELLLGSGNKRSSDLRSQVVKKLVTRP